MKTTSNIFAIVLAGGGGTRLWPASRDKTPKQFLRLNGSETMIQVTMRRLLPFIPLENIIIVTNKKYVQDVKNEVPSLSENNIICEPEKKDTALAMLVGALVARSRNPDAVIVNGACDHIVENIDLFVETMKDAINVASKKDSLIAVGIVPTRPDTAFGYIQAGDVKDNTGLSSSLYSVTSFREKPDQDTAKQYVESKKYYWNANMYVWSVDALISAFKKYQPQILQQVQPLIDTNCKNLAEQLPDIYKNSSSISIDYAISEKADNLLLIPGNFGWNDIGDWKVVYELQSHDKEGNAIMQTNKGDTIALIESKDNLVWQNKKKIVLYGVEDVVVVDVGDILMVCRKDKTQKIKEVVETLKKQNKVEYI